MAAITKITDVAEGEGNATKPAATEIGAAMHERVYQRLCDALISGSLAPGRALSVRSLAAEFDVSAMPAREAIRRLEALGALEFTSTRRVMVATMTSEKLDEIREARVALEPALARRALLRVVQEPKLKRQLIRDLQSTDAALDAAIRSGEAGRYTKYNSAFHFMLYRSAGASVLLELVESLWLRLGPFMRVIIGRLGTTCLIDDRHKEIMDALETENASALEAAVREDILHGMDNIDLPQALGETKGEG